MKEYSAASNEELEFPDPIERLAFKNPVEPAALTHYDAARTALASAHRVDEAKDIRDKAQALATYARQARDTQLMQWATEIRVRAERRCGELLREASRMGTRNRGHGEKKSESHDATQIPTISDIGLTKSQSSRYQKLAAMPEEHFETAVATAKETAGAVTSTFMLRYADELRQTRDAKKQLADARRNLDPVSRASAAWWPIESGLSLLMTRIGKAGNLPPCPSHRTAEILSLWSTISAFLSTHMEDTHGLANDQHQRNDGTGS
jgi:hypothetical protein